MANKIPIPQDEASRIDSLRSFAILDSAPEPKYDDIVRLVASICQTPISVISLVDTDRQWFKAKVGIDATETSRDLAFCSYTVCGNQPLIIENAYSDATFSRHPLVLGEPKIGFYVGIPLVAPEGHALGSLCAIDTKPRQLSADQLEALNILAAQVISLLELRRSMLRYKQQEALLATKVKLAALGEMAGGVAHEINTPLNVILFCAEQIQASAENKSLNQGDLLEASGLIIDTAQRISTVVKGLKTFARDGTHEAPEVIDLRVVVSDALSLCRERMYNNGVHLFFDNSLGPIMARCRVVQIGQVILNLLNNAFDAVAGTSNPWIRIESRILDGRIQLTVTDSGAGLKPEVKGKLFQPFFTTKGPQKGTGMGLSISKGIVESHEGSLYLEETCENTRFVIDLPSVVDVKLPLPRTG